MNLQTGIDKLGRGGRTGVQLNILGTPWMVAGVELVTSGYWDVSFVVAND